MSFDYRGRDLLEIPNLFSLLRILLTPIIGYFLWMGGNRGILISALLIIAAGITDFLDGFLARRLNKITSLGVILDPIADKIFVMVLIIELILFRGFPIWLAGAIIIRDILIMIGGAILIREKKIVVPSSLTGKYYFGAVALLIFNYVINFQFGKQLFLYVTIILLVASLANYIRVFMVARNNKEIEQFQDKLFYKIVRVSLTGFIILIYFYKLYQDLSAAGMI
jgi:cardiolipin synthase (CMP-forming)